MTSSQSFERPLPISLSESQKPTPIEDAFKEETPKSILWGVVTLNPSISILNFTSYLFLQLFFSFVVLSIDTLQISLLEIRYKVPKTEVYTTNSIILAFDAVFKILMSPLYGYLCDKIGRRIFVTFGVCSLCASALLFPRFSNVYPDFIFVRLLFANGVIATLVAPLLADYVDFNSKGKMAGLLTVMGSFSGYIASFFEDSDDLDNALDGKYLQLSIGGIAFGLIVCMGLKGGVYHKALYNDPNAKMVKKLLDNKDTIEKTSNKGDGIAVDDTDTKLLEGQYEEEGIQRETGNEYQQKVEEEEEKKNKIQKVLEGFRQARNPWILIGFMVTFLGVAQGGILTFVLAAWVSAKVKNTNENAQASKLSRSAMPALLVFALIFGYMSEKYSKFKTLIFTLMAAIAGMIFLILAPSPYSWMAYVAMVLTGVGNAGCSIFMNQLVYKYADPKYRGVVASAAQMLHVLGLMNSSMLGVYLMQFNTSIPLYIYMGTCLTTLITLICLYSSSKVMRSI